ncbi:MAG: DNRLRE domain-containing protein, partial [Eggerthellaceae bacterium]|nr:DNRLRE domain-containing protein [Eggerthellaceae bacterium]
MSFTLAFGLVSAESIAYAKESAQEALVHIQEGLATQQGSNTSGSQALSVDVSDTESGDDASNQDQALNPYQTGPVEPVDYYEIDEVEGTPVDIVEDATVYQLDELHFTTIIGGVDTAYIDDEGHIQEIDNTLIEQREGDDVVYENAANAFVAMLPASMDGKDKGFSFELDSGDVVELIPLDGDFSASATKDSAIRYANVREGIDFQYTLVGSVLKEDIVVAHPVEPQTFETQIKLPKGFSIAMEGDIAIVRDGAGDVVLSLAAPSMEDATGAASMGLALALDKREGKNILSLEVDWGWVNASERTYPVRIDPSIRIASPQLRATAVHSDFDTITGETPYLAAGYDDGIATGSGAFNYGQGHGMYRMYFAIDYDFRAELDDVSINSATLSIHQRRTYSNGETNFMLYRITDTWDFDTLNWEKQTGLGTQFVASAKAATEEKYLSFDIRDVVSNWAANAYSQHGFSLRSQDELNMQCEIFSNKETENPPRIEINWSIPNPVDDNYSLNKTTINLRPVVEQTKSGLTQVDGAFADGLATPRSKVSWVLTPGSKKGSVAASRSKLYPDSTAYETTYPKATKYHLKDSNWQSGLVVGLDLDTIYSFSATPALGTTSGKTVKSDTFLVYRAKGTDTLPSISNHYGVTLNQLAKDNGVADMLSVKGQTLFVRNPKTKKPYSVKELSDDQKKRIDAALIGRGLHCEYGFEPVNMNTGNFVLEAVDASVPEVEEDFELARTYNSKAVAAPSAFGRNWSFAYSDALSKLENGSFAYTASDGKVLFFEKQGSLYTCALDPSLTLKVISKNNKPDTYVIENRDGSSRAFDSWGLLESITSPRGMKTTIARNANKQVSSVTSPLGYTYSFVYGDFGLIKQATLPDGSKVKYSYDDNMNLVSVTDACGGVVRYAYDRNSYMLSWRDADGNTVCQNTYDSQGRVTKQVDALGGVSTLGYSNGKTIATDAAGNKTIYTYDSLMRTTSITYPDGYVETRAYDNKGNLIKNDGWTYTFDANGNRVSQTSPDGITTTYAYDAKNRLIKTMHPDGEVVEHSYSTAGDLTKTTSTTTGTTTYTYDAKHRKTRETDADGVSIAYSYSGASPTRVSDACGNVATIAYDKMGRALKTTDGAGNTSSVSFDVCGRVVSETDGAGATTSYVLSKTGLPKSITDANGNISTFTYDATYKVIAATDAAGNTAHFGYDALGNLVSAKGPTGATLQYVYDARGNQISSSDALGNMTNYTYDGHGNLLNITLANGASETYTYEATFQKPTSVTDALGNTQSYVYDSRGNLASTTLKNGALISYTYNPGSQLATTTDARGTQASYSYTAAGRLSSIDVAGREVAIAYDAAGNMVSVTDELGNETSFTYDGAGRLVSQTDAEGRATSYALDGEGRLICETDGEGNTNTFTYDGLGNITSTTDANGNTTTFTYDALSQLVSEIDALGGKKRYEYDAVGNLVKTIDELGNTTSFGYDAAAHLTSQTDALGNMWAYAYDALGNITQTTLPTGEVEAATYDALGNMVSLVDAAGLSFEMSYDASGNLVAITDSYGAREAYTYDEAGNIIEQIDVLGRKAQSVYNEWGELVEEIGFDGAKTTFEYDAAGNLVSSTDALGAKTRLGYDASKNITTVTDATGATTAFTFDKASRLISEVNAEGAQVKNVYDAAGNLIGMTDADGYEWGYSYDALNRLTTQTDPLGNATELAYDAISNVLSIIRPEGDASTYTYDALGRLTSTSDGTGAGVGAAYDAYSNVVQTTDALGASKSYTYDLHGALLSETDALGNTTEYIVDIHGNTTGITLANGASYTYEYDLADRLISIATPSGYKRSLEYDTSDNVVKESDNLGREQSYSYDALGNLVGAIDAKGGTTSYEYDVLGQLISSTDATGAKTSLEYDKLGRLAKYVDAKGGTSVITYDNRGNILRQITPEGRFTTYSYDGLSNLVSEADAAGNTTSYAYDKNSRLTRITDALGNTQASFTYDEADRIVSATDALDRSERFAYDAAGNITSVRDAAGNTSTYTYDILSRLTSATLPSGAATSYSYDEVGNLVAQTDAEGHTTKYAYDAEGKLSSKTNPSGALTQIERDLAGRITTITDPSGSSVHYAYDELNALIEKSYSGPAQEEPVLYTRDALSRATARTDSIGKASYTYDELGRVTLETDAQGANLSYAYDADGNLSEVIYPDDTIVRYTYDEAGNLIRVEAPDGTYSYTYNAKGAPTSLIRPDKSSTTYSYDEADQLISVVNADAQGKTISSYEYSYSETGDIASEDALETDTSGKAVKSSRSFAYDSDGRLVEFSEDGDAGTISRNYTYDAVGNRVREVRVSGTKQETITYSYDEDNKLTLATSSMSGATTYTYDDAGRLILQRAEGSEELSFEYGVEDRLQVVREGGRAVMAAAYDGDSNRVFQTTRHRSVTVLPEKIEQEKANGTNNEAIASGASALSPKTADALLLVVFGMKLGAISSLGIGSPAAIASGANAASADFLPLSTLADSFPATNAQVKSYAEDAYFDGWGTIPLERIEIGEDFESIVYVNSSLGSVPQVLCQQSSYTGTSNHLYGNTRLASLQGASATYYLLDGRGSTTAALSSNKVTSHYSWGAYGELLRGTYTESPFFGYDSEEYSPATNMLYLRARYLDVSLGSFSVEDTYLGDAFDPQSLNLYAYAQGNPVRYVDPTGHFLGSLVNKAWSGIKSTVSSVATSVRSFASNTFNTVRSAVSNVYNGARQVVSNIRSCISNSYRAPAVARTFSPSSYSAPTTTYGRATSTVTTAQQGGLASFVSNAGNMFNQALSGISSIAGPALTRAYNNASGAAQKVY